MRVNSKQRLLKRRKSALTRREDNVKKLSGWIESGSTVGLGAMTEEDKATRMTNLKRKLELATSEVSTLKSRITGHG